MTQEHIPQEILPPIPTRLDPWAIRHEQLRAKPAPSLEELENMSSQEYNDYRIAGFDSIAEQERKHLRW